LEGSRPETLCICAHIDELCNDDLSGCVVAMEIMRFIENLPNRNYSYMMLLVPELFGPIFFMDENRDKIRNTIGMLNLETVGAGCEWCLKKSLQEGSLLESILRQAIKQTGVSFRETGFFEGYGNDERVFEWPTFKIPGVALQRYPFNEYHTSNDNPDIIDEKYLNEALTICENFVEILENDYIPAYTYLFQPWLTRRDLYFDHNDNPEKYQKLNNQILFNIDGKHSLLDLSILAEIPFTDVEDYLSKFEKQGLIQRNAIMWPKVQE